MKTPAPDLRVEKTVGKLEKALFRLLSEKEMFDITVKELCALAEVNRSTFYAYFHSAGDLQRYLVDRYIQDFRQEIASRWTSTDNIESYYVQLLRFIRKKREAFTCLYAGSLGEGFIEATLPLTGTDSKVGSYPASSPLDAKQVKVFNAYGCHGMIKQWLLRDCQESVEEMAELLFRYTVRILSLPSKAPDQVPGKNAVPR